ncbi:sec-independent protein translocase protein [Salmonella enterica subsp. enterica serovar Heidelberg]|nr:sec-independent protein translocase protein [Salmonella enterica subsp. enterica serovar Heidelberg]
MAVEDTQPLITHLIELRKRLLNCIVAVLLIFLALIYFANDIYHLVAAPLIKQMPQGATMIATDVASPFFYAYQTHLHGVFDLIRACHFVPGLGLYRPGAV